MEEKEKSPAERIKEFLDFVRQCNSEYQLAYDAVNQEDRRLQDFAHWFEFAEDTEELYALAEEFQASRRYRRKNKDTVKRCELIVNFFQEKNPKDTLNRLEQILGKQRKEEEYLSSERVYKPRVK